MNDSNFKQWQKSKVEARQADVLAILEQLKKFKTSAKSVTEVAGLVAERLGDLESSRGGVGRSIGKACSSSLLRRDGPYRKFIDIYMLQRNGVESYKIGQLDSVAERVLSSYKLKLDDALAEIEKLKDQLKRSESKNRYVESGRSVLELNSYQQAQVDAMGKVATIFFDLILSTDYVKYDEQSGDLLAVSRARQVIVGAADISVYLNWRFRSKRHAVT